MEILISFSDYVVTSPRIVVSTSRKWKEPGGRAEWKTCPTSVAGLGRLAGSDNGAFL